MSGLKTSCRIRPNAIGDWQIMGPPGSYLQIGDAGPAGSAPVVGPDDLHVSGNCEIAGSCYLDGEEPGLNPFVFADDITLIYGADIQVLGSLATGEIERFKSITEEIEVTAGNSSAWGSASLAQQDSAILGVVTRITQAPGGGATLCHVGRSTNLDEFLQNGPVALGSVSNSATDGDGVNVGPVYSPISRVFKVTCNASVIGASLKIRITVYMVRFYPMTA